MPHATILQFTLNLMAFLQANCIMLSYGSKFRHRSAYINIRLDADNSRYFAHCSLWHTLFLFNLHYYNHWLDDNWMESGAPIDFSYFHRIVCVRWWKNKCISKRFILYQRVTCFYGCTKRKAHYFHFVEGIFWETEIWKRLWAGM